MSSRRSFFRVFWVFWVFFYVSLDLFRFIRSDSFTVWRDAPAALSFETQEGIERKESKDMKDVAMYTCYTRIHVILINFNQFYLNFNQF